jgi:hypothetical protein
MAKCAVDGCLNRVIACFQEITDVDASENAGGPYSGLKFCWCESHWDLLKDRIVGLRGKFIRPDE